MGFGDTFQQWQSMWDSLGTQSLDINDPAAVAKVRQQFAFIGKGDDFDQQIAAARAKIASERAPAPPGAPPDVADQFVQQARMLARRRALLGSGMDSTFITGPLGDTTAAPKSAPTLSGY